MKFLDQAKIYLNSGNGGAGCMSFRREKYIEFGGPDGGNGGRGGDVIFVADNRMNTLIDFRYQQHYKAKNGQGGMGKDRSGAHGDDCIIRVPVGTQILDEDQDEVLLDFTEEGQRVTFLKGGDGGFGNAHYKSSVNQAPRRTTPGWPGQEMAIWLRLKLIADVGLLGMPNAGKSTFLAASSNARPKIADYPFTTLHPNLGVVKAGDMDFVIADIPGLIEGAHEGHGLGHRFLGHVERTSVLLHLVDGTDDKAAENYRIIRGELEAYASHLAEKPEIVVLNKADALGEELAENQRKELEQEIGVPVFAMSGVTGEGVQAILYKLGDHVLAAKELEEETDNPWDDEGEFDEDDSFFEGDLSDDD